MTTGFPGRFTWGCCVHRYKLATFHTERNRRQPSATRRYDEPADERDTDERWEAGTRLRPASPLGPRTKRNTVAGTGRWNATRW